MRICIMKNSSNPFLAGTAKLAVEHDGKYYPFDSTKNKDGKFSQAAINALREDIKNYSSNVDIPYIPYRKETVDTFATIEFLDEKFQTSYLVRGNKVVVSSVDKYDESRGIRVGDIGTVDEGESDDFPGVVTVNIDGIQFSLSMYQLTRLS